MQASHVCKNNSINTAMRYDCVTCMEKILEYNSNLFAIRVPHTRKLPIDLVIESRAVNCLKCIIEKAPLILKWRNEEGDDPIASAIKQNRTEYFKMIFEALDPDAIKQKGYRCGNKGNLTMVHLAAMCKESDILDIIVKRDPQALYCTTSLGNVPAFTAAVAMSLSNIRFIAQNAPETFIAAPPPNQPDRSRTALRQIAQNARPAAIQILAKECPHLFDVIDADGFNVAHYVAESHVNASLKVILKHAPNTLVVQDTRSGNTAVHTCDTTMLPRLIKQFPEALTCLNKNGLSPIHTHVIAAYSSLNNDQFSYKYCKHPQLCSILIEIEKRVQSCNEALEFAAMRYPYLLFMEFPQTCRHPEISAAYRLRVRDLYKIQRVTTAMIPRLPDPVPYKTILDYVVASGEKCVPKVVSLFLLAERNMADLYARDLVQVLAETERVKEKGKEKEKEAEPTSRGEKRKKKSTGKKRTFSNMMMTGPGQPKQRAVPDPPLLFDIVLCIVSLHTDMLRNRETRTRSQQVS